MNNIITAILVASMFAGFPMILGKYVHNSPWINIVLFLAGFVWLVVPKVFQGTKPQEMITPKEAGVIVLCGILNAIALNMYKDLFSLPNSGKWVAIVTGLIPVFALALGLFFGQKMSVTQIAGLFIVCLGIWMMNKGILRSMVLPSFFFFLLILSIKLT